MPQRVLMLAQRMSVGGVSEHIWTLSDELSTAGWEIVVAANWDSPRGGVPARRFEDANIETVHIPFPEIGLPRPSMVRDMWRSRVDLRRAVAEIAPDVIHCHWRTVLPYLAGHTEPPVVFTVHSVNIGGYGTNLLYRIPRKFISISEGVSEDILGDRGVQEGRIAYVANGVKVPGEKTPDKAARQAARAELGLPTGEELLVVSVGRLEAAKRHDVTIDAIASLASTDTQVSLVVLGEGVLRRSLSASVERLGLQERVTFVGHQPPHPYLRAADVFVLASDFEGSSLAVMEAMMWGVVPLRTPGGGSAEQIQEGGTGLTFPFGDSNTLANQLRGLAADEKRRAQMGEAAAALARQRFSSRFMAEATAAVYRDAIRADS